MKPIISPWLFYFLNALGNINTICTSLFILSLIAIPVALIIGFAEECWTSVKDMLSRLKPVIIGYCIFLAVITVIPTKDTVYKMLVAKELTSDNLQYITEIAGNTAENVADYVIDIITRASEATQK